jgi:hypothetical protein
VWILSVRKAVLGGGVVQNGGGTLIAETAGGFLRWAEDKAEESVTRRKGEVTKRRIDRDFPHQVAILIPVGGLVARQMAMHNFCDMRSILYKTRSDLRHEPISDYVRFCFGDPAHVDAFMAEFGGERITIEPLRH